MKWHPGGFLASTNFTLSSPFDGNQNPHLTSSTPGLEACHVEDTSQASQPLNLRHVAPWLHRMGRHGQKHGEETLGSRKNRMHREEGGFLMIFVHYYFYYYHYLFFFCDQGCFLWSLWIFWRQHLIFPKDQLPSFVSGLCLCHMMLCLRWFWCLYTSNHGSMRRKSGYFPTFFMRGCVHQSPD